MCITVEVQESHYLSGSHTAKFFERVHLICKSANDKSVYDKEIYFHAVINLVFYYLPIFIFQ
jgi:hypothetical protein